MRSLLYVSKSRIPKLHAEQFVAEIVAHAQLKNARLELTGALIWTGDLFAQVLEGSTENLQTLMSDISNDPRHSNLLVVNESPIAFRRFPDWGMAYQGPSQFVSRHVERLLQKTSHSEQKRAGDWLKELALEFSRTKSVQFD